MHVAPIFLGDGTRLFSNVGGLSQRLVPEEAVAPSAATHLVYRVAR